MLMFTLPSVWPLQVYLDSWTQHSRLLCNFVLYNIGLHFHHQIHAQLHLHKCMMHFCFGPASSLFLELFLCSSPSSILDTYRRWGGGLIFWHHIFCLFILFMGFSRQEYSNDLSFPSPVDHIDKVRRLKLKSDSLLHLATVKILNYFLNDNSVCKPEDLSLYSYPQDHGPNALQVAGTMAHEMGHNLGMFHDNYNCKCPSIECVMGESLRWAFLGRWYLFLFWVHSGLCYSFLSSSATC